MSDWEDEPTHQPVDSETWKNTQEDSANDAGNDDDGGWGGDDGALTWAQEDGGVQLQSNRFNDRDDNLWGGGGSGNRPNNSYGRGRGGGRQNFQDRNSRFNDRQRNGDRGFGYDNSRYSNSRDSRHQNGYSSNNYSRGNSGSTNGWGNNDSDGWGQNGGRKGAGSGCFKCGDDGHFARECSSSTNSFQSKGRPGGGRYIPKEEDNFDELYKNSISSGINFDR